MQKNVVKNIFIFFLLIPTGFLLADTTVTSPSSAPQPLQPSTSTPPPSSPISPPPFSGTGMTQVPPSQPPVSGDGQNFQRDGVNYQRDGANYQKDGSGFMMQNNNSSRGNQNQFQGDQNDKQNSQFDKINSKMEKQQQAMAKRSAKQLQVILKTVTKLQAKLQKTGISFSSECQTSLSDAYTVASAISNGSTDYDQNDIAESMQNVNQCQMMAQQLLQTPTIYKTLSKAVIKFKKKNPDQNIDDEWNTVDKDYSALKDGSFSQDDLYTFFDDARTLAEDIGINTSQFDNMPQGPQNQSNSGMMQQGASVIKSVGLFFSNLLK